MPKDDQHGPNGRTPKLSIPESLHFERRPAKCHHCGKIFENLIVEVIEDVKQLRCGGLLVFRGEFACLYCGAMFTWNVHVKDIEKMSVLYGELLQKKYFPE